MARYLAANNPVKYWYQTGGDLVDGYLYRGGAWLEGQGYQACASNGYGKKAAFGQLQLDGTFCPVVTDWDWYQYGFKSDRYTEGYEIMRWGGRNSVKASVLETYYTTTGGNVYWNNDGTLESLIRVLDYDSSYRYMYVSGDNIYSLRECSFWQYGVMGSVGISPLPYGQPYPSYMGGGKFVFVYSDGRGFIWNSDTREVENNRLWIDDLSDFWLTTTTYSIELNAFIVVCWDKLDAGDTVRVWDDKYQRFKDRPCSLRVYLNEGVPTGVSDLTMDPDPPQKGHVSNVEVYVHGAQGEPVENETVTWSIVSGGGSLGRVQSVTDAGGVAVNTYIPPSAPGDVDIRAEVSF